MGTQSKGHQVLLPVILVLILSAVIISFLSLRYALSGSNQQGLEEARREIDHVISDWNQASNRRNYKELANYYDDYVTLYDQYLSRDEVIEFKRQYYNKFFDHDVQMLGSSTIVSNSGTNLITVKFRKKVFRSATDYETSATLTFRRVEKGWKITAETDDEGNKGIKIEHKAPSIPLSAINSCDKAAEALFLSSGAVKQLLVQPRMTYSIDSTPSTVAHPGGKYWFSIRTAGGSEYNGSSLNRFNIDPVTGTLYGMMGDSAYPVMADTAYMMSLLSRCNK